MHRQPPKLEVTHEPRQSDAGARGSAQTGPSDRPEQAHLDGCPETDVPGVQAGRLHRLGRGTDLLRRARHVPGADRTDIDHRRGRRSAEDHRRPAQDRRRAGTVVCRRHVLRTDAPGRAEPVGRFRAGPGSVGRSVVRLRLRRRVRSSRERHLRGRRGPALLQATAAAAVGDPGLRAPACPGLPLPGRHRTGRASRR